MATESMPGGVTAPKGFTAAGIYCGIRKNKDKKDLALIVAETDCDAAAVYTQNKVKGAPILVTQRHLRNGKARAVVVNSGNANTCNADGEEKAENMCDLAAHALHIAPDDVVVASTGVIGQVLPIEPIRAQMGALTARLSRAGGEAAAEAIMTTDTRRKELSVSFTLGGKECRIGGMAKGSGMIHPNMATMLCFITTDVNIDGALLRRALSEAADASFNMVSVDGDTSTNDMACILASGLAGNARIERMDDDYELFFTALREVLIHFSREIARDGEGATKLIECRVTGAQNERTARTAAKAVVCSSLVKAAMFGSDANWGRVLCALGYADAPIDVSLIDVAFSSVAGTVQVCRGGAGMPFSEEDASSVLMRDEVRILVDLHAGGAAATAWGCDLTYDYVKINGDYRT